MKSGETVLVLRALIVRGGAAIALLGLVACATTNTTPVSRQADPAFARRARDLSDACPTRHNRHRSG